MADELKTEKVVSAAPSANKETSSAATSNDNMQVSTTAAPVFYDPSQESRMTRLGLTLESFKRAPGSTGGIKIEGSSAVVEAMQDHHNPMLQQQITPSQLNMIAVGGSIGTGLFIGTGQALRNGGPAGVLIAWCIIGVMLINVTQALGEMCIMYPVSGGFYTLSVRFLDPAFGLAMGYNYAFQWFVTLPLEITAAAIVVSFWTEAVPAGVWITIFYLIIIIINLFGTRGYAVTEFWSSIFRLVIVAIFVLVGIVMNCGGGPSTGLYDHYIGGEFWRNPGAFANGFKGVCTVFVTAAFSFAGTELVGLAATETPNPRKSLPGAVKGTFWRIGCIYILSLLIIGLCVPWDTPALADGSDGTARTSPFVILVDLAGIRVLPHIMNAAICVSVMSIGMASVYAGSRVLTALAETGFAPKCFAMVDKAGRPLWSVVFNLAWGAIAYVSLASSGGTVFDWLLALSGLSTLFTWASICLCHIRFRAAWKFQGHSVEELPFKAIGGVYASWAGFVLIALVLVAQFYVAIWPIGGMDSEGSAVAYDFFLIWLGAPICLAMWIYAVIRFRRFSWLRLDEIDLDTGRKSWLTVEEMRLYRAERAAAPLYIRIYRALFSN
ncbi:APC amino acid permease [Leucosporidium creatinivorum]|uniref:APC amino acid permease n=1 Tax=Leucosporidium creatinivorum TaxID=106004 RepID=A0A1Y2D2P5_9BASI|nr:APC amino acid permease [Leucosporidium creatinivorum]